VRAYEYALNGLLERLDAIESDDDEKIRDARRKAVREVEKALEDVERKVKERAPRLKLRRKK
jgi:vacuolar-type H+-ATPase subunit E/Vma4